MIGKYIWRFLAALALGVYFFRLTRGALHVALSPDDITNIYRAYSYPVSLLVRANLLFFETSPFYRPFANVWYRIIFHFAGINPLPYHAINLVILAANAFLTYSVARRLSGSRETGWLVALLACYHTRFNGLYFDTGFVFDVLCYFFYFAAFLLYVRIRQEDRYPGAGALAACCALYICALNSKEIAVTLPLCLALYEWLYHSSAAWHPRALWRWLLHEGRAALLTGVVALLFAFGRATGASSLLQNTAYRPVFTWDRFRLTSSQFLGDLFFTPGSFPPALLLLLWVVLAAIAWVSKSRTLRFAWLFLMLSPLPVAFLEPRGAAQYYIPLFGWALYGAAALVGISRLLLRPLHGPAGLWAERLRAPALLASAALFLYPYYKAQGHDNVTSVTVDGAMLQSLAAQTLSLHPLLPAGSHLLLLNETDEPAWDVFLQAVRLNYRDHDIKIDRARRISRAISDRDLALYDHVLDYRGGRLVAAERPPDPRLKPLVLATPHGPEIYHTDWSIVTAQTPAHRGEVLIVKLAGLGATEPDVPVDHPFPSEPLAPVRWRVGAALNGLRVPALNAFGWPGAVNTYRVDIRVPEAVRPGLATLRFLVREVTAPPVELPVR